MPARDQSHSLLFGLLGVQLSFLTTEALKSGLALCQADPAESLADALVSAGQLSEEHSQLLESVTAAHLEKHDGDVDRSLASLPPVSPDAIATISCACEAGLRSQLVNVPVQKSVGCPEASNRYETIVEESVQGIVIHQDYRICYANPAYARLLGYENPADVLGKVVFEIGAVSDEWPLMRERTAAVLRGETVDPHPGWWGVRQDGRRIRISATASRILWDGRPAIVSFFSDITKRYHAEERLVQSRREVEHTLALLDTLQDNAPVGFAFMDCNLRFVRINETLAAINGKPAQEHIGRTIAEVLPELASEIVPLHEQVIRTQEPIVNLEVNAQQPADPAQPGTWLCSYFPVSASDQLLGVGVVVVEITERKQAALRLQASQQTQTQTLAILDTLQKTAPVGIAVVDCDFRYMRINEMLAEINGLPVDEHIGRTVQDVLPDLWPIIGPLMRGVLESGEPVAGMEVNAPHPSMPDVDGSWLVSYYPVCSGGEMLGLGTIVVDITARKGMEEALRDSDRRKDEFLAMLAHELRNPLTPIRSALEIMQLQPHAEALHQEARGIIDRQACHLVRIVDDLLDVSRITRGQIQLDRQRVNAAEILSDAVAASRPLMQRHGHEFRIRQAEPIPELHVDSTRIVQVLTNLLNNAARYTEPGGHIELSAHQESQALAVRIRDNGVGISETLKPHLFDLFVQSDQSLDRSRGGLGIGLTVARQLVEMHGGSIEVESDGEGRGSEFTVRLPLPDDVPADMSDCPEAMADEPVDLETRSLRVLLVDDNEAIIASAGMLLELLGHEVHTATDGPTALEAAARIRPEVFLVDIGLPGMTGYDVVRELRTNPEFRETFAIAISGYGRDKDVEKAYRAGFDGHLLKPVALNRLREVLALAATQAPTST